MGTKLGGFFVVSAMVVAGIAFASSMPDEVPCALLMKFGRGTQIIPPEGKVQTRFLVDQPVVCGSMIVTHAEGVWIRHSNQALFKIGPNSFFELGKRKSDVHRLYRGALLMSAPPSVPTLTVTTPNGEVEFKGGVAWMQYSPIDKETTAASFNRSFDFKNKFNSEAQQSVSAGEISHLALGQDRVIPTQPVVMSPTSVSGALLGFELADTERKELSQVVERVFESRAKSLTADIEQWNDLDAVTAERSIASVKEKKSKNTRPAIDPKEAQFTMELLKKHLYGDDDDLRMIEDAPSRKPASAERLQDPVYEKSRKKKAQETQRLIKQVSDLKE